MAHREIDRGLRRWLGSAIIAFSFALAMPALAQAESLTITAQGKPTVGQPYSIIVKGVADGTHRLFVYADYSGYSCGSTPNSEYAKAGVVALSGVAGEPPTSGSFSISYGMTPPTELFRICGYLDDTPTEAPDVAASETAGDPVNEYLEKEGPALPTGTSSGPGPGAIAPFPVNPQLEREFYERVAREQAAQKAASKIVIQRCTVPSLKGESLNRARRILLHAHCKLGKVHKHRGAHGPLVVTGQAPAHGKQLGNGAGVALTLGTRKG